MQLARDPLDQVVLSVAVAPVVAHVCAFHVAKRLHALQERLAASTGIGGRAEKEDRDAPDVVGQRSGPRLRERAGGGEAGKGCEGASSVQAAVPVVG